MSLPRLHRLSAALLAAFIVAHILNHLVLLFGIEANRAMMEILRRVYRHPLVEPVLYVLFLSQIGLGLTMAFRGGAPTQTWPRIQVVSGVILALFLIIHLAAPLSARHFYPGMDTNVFWAASVVSRPPFMWFFVPYYWLGVTALFGHVAAALAFRRSPEPGGPAALAVLAAGPVIAGVIVASYSGAVFPIHLPPAYETYLKSYYLTPPANRP